MTEYGLSWKGLFVRAFHPRSSKDTIKLSVSVSVSQDAAPVCMLLDWDSLLWWMLHIWHGRSHMPMELRSLAIWQLWTGGTDDPSFHVAQLQVCGSVAAGICLNQRKEGGEGGLLTPVSPRTRPPLWRGSLGWLSGQARDRYDRAADKGQAACWEQRCSPTQTRLLLSSLGLQRDPQLAAETPQSLWAPGFSTKLITVALMGLQNTNTENQKQL